MAEDNKDVSNVDRLNDVEPSGGVEVAANQESGDIKTAEAVAGMPADGEKVVREKKSRSKARVVSSGIAHIKSTFNNTLISITDTNGGIIAWSNAGRMGFKGSRKSTAFAATLVGQDVGRQAASRGMREIEVRVQGAGAGRESAVRALQSSGLAITLIKDVTPIAHNGCRPRKRRRV